jgi:hypothetical protein
VDGFLLHGFTHWVETLKLSIPLRLENNEETHYVIRRLSEAVGWIGAVKLPWHKYGSLWFCGYFFGPIRMKEIGRDVTYSSSCTAQECRERRTALSDWSTLPIVLYAVGSGFKGLQDGTALTLWPSLCAFTDQIPGNRHSKAGPLYLWKEARNPNELNVRLE